jgi:hypothetical protein
VLLGIGMQAVLLAFSGVPGAAPFIADLTQKIAWASLVCVGVAVATAVSQARPAAAGLAGMLVAPAAFVIAKTIHKGLSQALTDAPVADAPLALTLSLVVIKGAEYAVFTYWLTRFTRAGRPLRRYLLLGVLVGAAAAAAVVGATVAFAPARPAASKLVAATINEMLFPVGCAVVLFTATALAGPGGRPDPQV